MSGIFSRPQYIKGLLPARRYPALSTQGLYSLLAWFTLIPACISNYIYYKVCDAITYPVQPLKYRNG